MISPPIVLLSVTILFSAAQAAEKFWDELPLSPSTALPSAVLDDYWNSEFQRVNREVVCGNSSPYRKLQLK